MGRREENGDRGEQGKLTKRSGDERARKANKTEESLASSNETHSWDLTKEVSESTTPTVCGAEIVACGRSRGSS